MGSHPLINPPGSCFQYNTSSALSPNATGVGIWLPVEDAGHRCAIPAILCPQIDVHELDLTLIDLSPTMAKPNTSHITGSHALALHLVPLPFRGHEFNFVVCNTHHWRLHLTKRYPSGTEPICSSLSPSWRSMLCDHEVLS
ncbi:hypothetical protein RSOLAG1IB_08656 [Rhizoctonia solani AG-1 IB]|uniref:Uncharacterized protein n=1 Tax=Thanatephorus cucumeris (strain AG1-IB / isolate 7/3/14) TaxID=1108050 RepID=A0A0B7FLN9_THACB|nr:hypothetical protein RSOLAG1IB_08656 [Rhizoctonia solani AG-1 IB]